MNPSSRVGDLREADIAVYQRLDRCGMTCRSGKPRTDA
jgi:hypothetical protein